jgi:ABC-type uncharacterized transport system permease subunit
VGGGEVWVFGSVGGMGVGAGVAALAALIALWVRISTTRVSIKAVGSGPESDETMGVEQATNKRRQEEGSRKKKNARRPF